MTEKKLRVGIAGYGVVGTKRRHFIDQTPLMKTVAVCDNKFTNEGTFADGVRYYRDYVKLLQEPLDVLFVSLPNYLAAEVTVSGLEKGLHVFCEKPPGRNVADIEQVIAAERKTPGLLLKYGFNHRYHYSVQEALEIVKAGTLGQIVNLRGVYGKSKIIPFSGGWRATRQLSGGGILLDQGIHMVDLMRLFCGEFDEVKSFISNGYWGHDVEDNAYAIMRDRLGRVSMLHSSATQWRHRFSLEIALTEGFLVLEGILSGSKSYGQEKLIVGKRDESDTGCMREESRMYLEDNSWADEINEFANAIVNNQPIVHGTSQDALNTMQMVYRIYEADAGWNAKYIHPDTERSN
jgi:predicted dehydrogenase